jgi:hypothetical protein
VAIQKGHLPCRGQVILHLIQALVGAGCGIGLGAVGHRGPLVLVVRLVPPMLLLPIPLRHIKQVIGHRLAVIRLLFSVDNGIAKAISLVVPNNSGLLSNLV